MSEVVKRGYISVRRRNLLSSSSYKQRYVVLRMGGEGQGKLVEVWDSQTSDKDPYRLVLGNLWTVQSKPSSSGKRYAFQLLVADEVVLTFGCASGKDREEWMTAFDVFRKMALPVSEHPALQASIINEKNFFSVFLSKTHSSLAIHQGQYMLSLDNEAISLHWITTAAIAHTWPRKTVQEFGMRGSNLVLKVCRAGRTSSNVEFEFRATNSTTVAILKRWNIVLMESIAANCGDPEQMNYIGKVLNKHATDNPDTGGGSRLSKSFRKRSQSTKERQTEVKRSGSFSGSKSATLRPGMLSVDTPSPQSTSGNNSPQKPLHHVPLPLPSTLLAGDMGEAARPSHMQSSPPPLPPRPLRDYSSSEEDSDYAYIKEDEVKGPAKSPHSPSQSPGGTTGERTVDQELEDLEISMKKERKEKRRKAAQEKKRAVTLSVRPNHQRPPLFFTPADPEDYLEPLSSHGSGSSRPRSTGDYETPLPSHDRSCSEPDTSFCTDSKSLSQPTIHTLHCTPPHLSPTPELCETPPALPSRAWRSKQSPDRSKDDSDISPYAVVHKILPGKILGKTVLDALSPRNGTNNSPTVAEQHQTDQQPPANEQSPEPSENSADSSTSPAAAQNSTSVEGKSESAPPIPPRSPIKEKLSLGSSTSSVASNHSLRSSHGHAAGVRCSKCLRQRRAPVDKTLSEHRGQPMSQGMPPLHHLEKSSLPDLNTTVSAVVPENNLQQRRQRAHHRGRIPSATESRSSSDGSSSSLHTPANYLEVVPDSGASGSTKNNRGRNSDPENLQILDDFLQYFDDKVNSLNQGEGSSPDQHRQPAAFNSLPHSNGYTPPRRMNGVKDPPILQRSNTLASSINHAQPQHPTMPNKSLSFTTMGSRSPAPPIPPRSDISLGGQGRAYPTNHHQPLYSTGYHHPRPWGRASSSGSFSSTSGDSRSPPALYGGRTRQSSSSSIHSGSPSPTIVPPPHPPRSWQNLAKHFTNAPPESEGSSTVFIHHLRHNRRVMHSHMV